MSRVYIPKLLVGDAFGKYKVYGKCISFVFEREMYTPYNKCSGIFVCDNDIDLYSIRKIGLQINDEQIFDGTPDDVTIRKLSGISTLIFTARGFSSMLGQNQPQPGINSDCDLYNLITKNFDGVNIEIERDTPVESYIYVRPSSTLWEAVTAYSLKAMGTYPYIYGRNKVMVSKKGSVEKDYSAEEIVETGICVNTVNMLSDIYMKGTSEDYDYTYHNDLSNGYKIKRKKYYDLDKQWLYDTQKGLEYRAAYSNRKYNSSYFVYKAFNNEQLFDKIKLTGSDLNGKYINRVRLKGDSRGITTKVWCYNDTLEQKQV